MRSMGNDVRCGYEIMVPISLLPGQHNEDPIDKSQDNNYILPNHCGAGRRTTLYRIYPLITFLDQRQTLGNFYEFSKYNL